MPGGYDKSRYAVERLFVPAKDGVGIPVTVVYRKDKFKRGENPLFVYGYGSYGITIPDTFFYFASAAVGSRRGHDRGAYSRRR